MNHKSASWRCKSHGFVHDCFLSQSVLRNMPNCSPQASQREASSEANKWKFTLKRTLVMRQFCTTCILAFKKSSEGKTDGEVERFKLIKFAPEVSNNSPMAATHVPISMRLGHHELALALQSLAMPHASWDADSPRCKIFTNPAAAMRNYALRHLFVLECNMSRNHCATCLLPKTDVIFLSSILFRWHCSWWS